MGRTHFTRLAPLAAMNNNWQEITAMEVSEIKNKIRETIEQLPAEKLVVVLDLLEDLQQSEEDLTQALLNDPEFMKDYREAKEDIRTGQTVTWDAIKRDV